MGKRKSQVTAAVTSSIEHHPNDLNWCGWRFQLPLSRPEPAPFNHEESLHRLSQFLNQSEPFAQIQWHKFEIATSLSRQEAHFWLIAMTTRPSLNSYLYTAVQPEAIEAFIHSLAQQAFSGDIALPDLLLRLVEATKQHLRLPRSIARPLATLFPIGDIVVGLLQAKTIIGLSQCRSILDNLNDAVNHNLRYSLTPEEMQQMRDTLRPHLKELLDFTVWRSLGNEFLPLVESWTPATFADRSLANCYELRVIFSLEQPQLVETHLRRLKLPLRTPECIRIWMAHTEFSALDYVRDSIKSASKKEAKSLIAALGSVKATETAPYMLELSLDSKAPEVARDWLRKNPKQTIAGLVPIAAGSDRLAKAAVKVLRDLNLKGHGAKIQDWIDQQTPDIAEQLRTAIWATQSAAQSTVLFDDQTTPDWLKQAIAKLGLKIPGTPQWLPLEELPPIRVAEMGLNPSQVTALIAAIKESTLDSPHPLVVAVKAHAEPESTDAFVCKVFEHWQQQDMPAREKWVMWAMGHFGSDAAPLKLASLVIAWRSELKHQRVTWGLDTLKTMDSDTALMQLHSITQKSRHPGLRERAAEHLKDAARRRKLSMTELEDRIVPDCGLDAQGKKEFDFGPRQFQFAIGSEMKPMLRDDKGKLLSNLPKPNSKDDADLANQAVTAWKVLKKQVDAVSKVQSARLEQAMVTERRWSVAEFERWLVQHPLMTHLVQRLLWAGYTSEGNLPLTFRVAEDRTYTSLDDELMSLDGIESIALIHPLHLTAELRQQWSQLWSEYELFQPFPQIERELYFPTLEEQDKTVVTRFKDIAIPGLSLVGDFERRGWLRGSSGDGGGCHQHCKVYSQAQLIVGIEYEGGIAMWDVRQSGDIKITDCYFAPLHYYNSEFMFSANRKYALPLGKVNPIVFSEVIRDIANLAAKSGK
ncbi:MAG: DUF4132 domain-containing protein [Thermosynechococcaceae cyanobacterium]